MCNTVQSKQDFGPIFRILTNFHNSAIKTHSNLQIISGTHQSKLPIKSIQNAGQILDQFDLTLFLAMIGTGLNFSD